MCKNDWESGTSSFIVLSPQVVLKGMEVLGDIGWHLFGVLIRNILCGAYGENKTTESLKGRSVLSSS